MHRHKRSLFIGCRRQSQGHNITVFELIAGLTLDVFLETPYKERLDILLTKALWIGDARRIEHTHKVRKALGPTIVRRCARQHQRITLRRQKPRELTPLTTMVRD